MIVLHHTGMRDCAAARDRLCDPVAEVSAHYLISARGRVWQLVSEARRAWHAGAGRWGEVTDVNSRSIGIELDNPGDIPFSEPQMSALETVMHGIMRRWRIPPHRVIAHGDMAPGRKCDPGPRFDWRRLAMAGLSVWPVPAAGNDFFADAVAFGYPHDAAPDAVLAAFRRRFRPWASGLLDGTDAALAADLARRFPVDRAVRTA